MSLDAVKNSLGKYLHRPDWRHILLLLAGSALALAIRISLLDYKSPDFLDYGRVWLDQLRTFGVGAFRHEFADYNPPYLYLLLLVTRLFPGLPDVVAVKVPSIAADYVCAVFAYLIVRVGTRGRNRALLAYMALLLAPTVMLNGSFWGQADSILAACILASLFGVLSKRSWLATTAFGVALAFKLQAVFLLPFLFALTLRGNIRWKHWLSVPAVLFLALVPAWAAGGDLARLLSIYVRQVQNYPQLSLNAPTVYAWFPGGSEIFNLFFPAGLGFALAVASIFVVLIVHSNVRLSRALFVELAALCVVLVPFVTPKMHERYFFLADVLSLVLAFYVPSLFLVALIVNLSSFFAYTYIFSAGLFDPATLALAMLFALVVLVSHSVRELFPDLARAPGGGRS